MAWVASCHDICVVVAKKATTTTSTTSTSTRRPYYCYVPFLGKSATSSSPDTVFAPPLRIKGDNDDHD
jgi:hypothetical protein